MIKTKPLPLPFVVSQEAGHGNLIVGSILLTWENLVRRLFYSKKVLNIEIHRTKTNCGRLSYFTKKVYGIDKLIGSLVECYLLLFN